MALRCFIAVEIPEGVKRGISDIVNDLKKSSAEVKWIAQENIHITMQFLGRTDEALIPLIKEALDKILSPYSPFYIRISHAGCFPEGKRPRIIWVGIEEPGILQRIQADITNGMAQFGFQKEQRDFTPHVTIGRVKSNRNMTELLRRLEEIRTIRLSDFEVRNITLMKSELHPSGARYYSLAEIPFGRRINVNEREG